MGGAATVVWLSEQPPSADATRALEAFARARGVSLRAPAEDSAPELTHDEADASAVEASIARAREATAQLDAEACERWLARAEGRLRAHPELPQSAFLMAEVQRAWAVRFARLAPADPARAERARAAADALDGGRAIGVGELAGAAPRAVAVTLAFEDAAEVRVDGRSVRPGDAKLAPGEHHVTVARDGVVRFAQWVSLAEGAALRLPSVSAAPCSTADVARARGGSEPVRCGAWIAARAGDRPGVVRIAWCAGASCGAPADWTAAAGATGLPISYDKRGGVHIPAWLIWTTAGLAAVGAGVAILFASGVFDAAPRTTRFVQGGSHVE